MRWIVSWTRASRGPIGAGRVGCVDDDHGRNRFAARELARELERDVRAVAVAPDDVGAARPQLAQRAHPVVRPSLRWFRNAAAVEAVRVHA
jgi:hypothetical protein